MVEFDHDQGQIHTLHTGMVPSGFSQAVSAKAGQILHLGDGALMHVMAVRDRGAVLLLE